MCALTRRSCSPSGSWPLQHTPRGAGALADRLSLSERAQAWLGYIPGAVLVSIVAPQVLNAGPSGLIAALAVVLVARRRAFSMLTGVLVVLAVRTLESGIF